MPKALFERSFSLELPQYSAIDNAAHRHVEDEMLRAYRKLQGSHLLTRWVIQMEQSKPVGRPTNYNSAIAALICSRIAEGESLRGICREDDMPSMSSVFKWLAEIPQFSELYIISRDTQADTLADDILHIADTPMLGVKTKTTEKGIETMEGDMIEHRRLQVDARKWIAAKLKPRKYGEKVEQTHVGDKERPVVLTSLDAAI